MAIPSTYMAQHDVAQNTVHQCFGHHHFFLFSYFLNFPFFWFFFFKIRAQGPDFAKKDPIMIIKGPYQYKNRG